MRADRAAISTQRAGDFLDDRAGRRHDVERRGLIPDGGEPFGRDGRRQRAAGHEPEIARSGRRHQAGLGRAREIVDDARRVDAGRRAVDRRARLGDPARVARRPDRSGLARDAMYGRASASRAR